MSNPIYVHDCDDCYFLGNDEFHDHPVDMYVCPQNGSPTIVIRQSDVGHEYVSWNMISLKHPRLYMSDDTFFLAYKYYAKAEDTLASK